MPLLIGTGVGGFTVILRQPDVIRTSKRSTINTSCQVAFVCIDGRCISGCCDRITESLYLVGRLCLAKICFIRTAFVRTRLKINRNRKCDIVIFYLFNTIIGFCNCLICRDCFCIIINSNRNSGCDCPLNVFIEFNIGT